MASTVILQGAQLPMRIYTVADGLAGNQINCIIQDSHGFIWLCTEEGLSRFDGYQFPNFGSAQGLSGTVNDLLEIRSGEYWVASPHGVYYFSPGVSGRPRRSRDTASGTSPQSSHLCCCWLTMFRAGEVS